MAQPKLATLANAVLFRLYEHAEKSAHYLTTSGIIERLERKTSGIFVEEAATPVEKQGLIHTSHSSAGEDKFKIIAKGIVHVQNLLEDPNSFFSRYGKYGNKWLFDGQVEQVNPKEIDQDSQEITNRLAPTANGWVRLDHNSLEYRSAVTALDDLSEAVRSSNEFAQADPEEHQQRTAELNAAKSLLAGVRIAVSAIRDVILPPLQFFATKFGDATMGALAAIAIEKVQALFANLSNQLLGG